MELEFGRSYTSTLLQSWILSSWFSCSFRFASFAFCIPGYITFIFLDLLSFIVFYRVLILSILSSLVEVDVDVDFVELQFRRSHHLHSELPGRYHLTRLSIASSDLRSIVDDLPYDFHAFLDLHVTVPSIIPVLIFMICRSLHSSVDLHRHINRPWSSLPTSILPVLPDSTSSSSVEPVLSMPVRRFCHIVLSIYLMITYIYLDAICRSGYITRCSAVLVHFLHTWILIVEVAPFTSLQWFASSVDAGWLVSRFIDFVDPASSSISSLHLSTGLHTELSIVVSILKFCRFASSLHVDLSMPDRRSLSIVLVLDLLSSWSSVDLASSSMPVLSICQFWFRFLFCTLHLLLELVTSWCQVSCQFYFASCQFCRVWLSMVIFWLQFVDFVEFGRVRSSSDDASSVELPVRSSSSVDASSVDSWVDLHRRRCTSSRYRFYLLSFFIFFWFYRFTVLSTLVLISDFLL